MDQLRRVLDQIKAQLLKLTLSQRLLIGSLVVVMLMALFVVSQYASGRDMVELMPGASPAAQQRAIEFLQVNGIEHRVIDGKVMAPSDRKYAVLAQLGQRGALPDDTSLLFSNLADKTPWTMSPEQARGLQLIALQNELGRVIAQFQGIRAAQVFVDAPAPKGLGQAVRTPTATATVFSEGSRALTQDTVDAIAHLIASSKSGLRVEDVRVIDGSTNRQHRARSEDDMVATTYLEQSARVEGRVRDKLLGMLSYIDGVVVAVNAQVDVRKIVKSRESFLPPGAGTVTVPTHESTTERTETGASNPGEAGVRPNTSLDIARAGSSRSSFSDNQTESTLESRIGNESQHVTDPRGMPTKINATINVPRGYFVKRWRTGQGANADPNAEPAEAALTQIVQDETARIKADVGPLLETAVDEQVATGVVQVSMIPDTGLMDRGGGGAGGASAGFLSGGGLSVLASGLVKTAVLGALAVAALVMMALSLRKASKPVELPSARELVGVPPALMHDTDMIGEADEADAALAGVEMTDDELQLRKKVEQVTTLVREKPADAARLLGRWIAAED